MLRIHLMQHWFGHGDPAMEEVLCDVTLVDKFAGLSLTHDSMPDETTILNFWRLLETHNLAFELLRRSTRI